MSPTRRRLAAPFAALTTALTLALAGCIPTLVSDDATSASPPPLTTSSAPASPTTPPDLVRAGRQLDETEAKALLPPTPKGIKEQPPQPPSTQRSSDPKECVDVLRLGWHARKLAQSRVARATRGWTAAKSSNHHDFKIQSYSRPVGPALLDKAGSALSTCSSFALIGRDSGGSFDLRLLTEPRSVTPIGEQTFAVRVITFDQFKGQTKRVYVDYLLFRVGNNIVEVSHTTLDKSLGMEDLEKSAADILAKMKK